MNLVFHFYASSLQIFCIISFVEFCYHVNISKPKFDVKSYAHLILLMLLLFLLKLLLLLLLLPAAVVLVVVVVIIIIIYFLGVGVFVAL